MDVKFVASYIFFNDTVWPNPSDPGDIEWTLRYGNPTKNQLLVAASYVSAYKALIEKTNDRRTFYANQIKRALRERATQVLGQYHCRGLKKINDDYLVCLRVHDDEKHGFDMLSNGWFAGQSEIAKVVSSQIKDVYRDMEIARELV